MPDPTITVRDNPERSRYEIFLDGDLAGYSVYVARGSTLMFTHTKVDPHYEGHGVGSALARAALDDVRAKGMSVIARCPFIAEYIERHLEYVDLLADRT